jgi:acetyl esterase/lipase
MTNKLTVLLILMLLVGCTAPTATPSPTSTSQPTETAIPATATPSGPPVQPEQPASGPGGSDYEHGDVLITEVNAQVWVFEPAEPAPESAPVVAFAQGAPYAAYNAWITHIVKHGSIVIFQTAPQNPVGQRMTQTIAGLQAGLDALSKEGHVQPDLARVTLVGHSIGGVMAVELAAAAEDAGLPVPIALFIVQPATSTYGAPLSQIDPDTLMLVQIGVDDRTAGEFGAKDIWEETAHIPDENRDYLRVFSDDHGSPGLMPNHMMPVSDDHRGVDAQDIFALWRLLDALMACASDGTDCEVALGNTPEQRFMGLWTDGTPIQELEVTDTP